jgi:hypothetical protein
MQTLSEQDWNFDNVPCSELVACCYWEYARESAFIRGLRQRCWECQRSLYLKGQWWNESEDKKIHADLQKVQSIGYPAEVFLRGFFHPPDGVLPDVRPLKPDEIHHLTASFPKPWLELAIGERAYRSKINSDVEAGQRVPFTRGFFLHVNDIAKLGPSQSWTRKQLLESHPSVIYGSGVEMAVVGIDWSAFTNEEIVNCFRKWVKANRPPDIPVPNKQGHKRISDRVKLERLAVMRLLHRCKVAELRTLCPGAWKRYDTPNRRWRKDVEKAYAHFQELFPFLDKNEFPLSWPPKDWPEQVK